jgi:integrase
VRLRIADVRPRAAGVRYRTAVRIAMHKRDRHDCTLFIERPAVERVLLAYLASRHCPQRHRRDGALFTFTYASLRAVFMATCRRLGLPPGVVLHSLRKTGVTHDYMQGTPYSAIKERGRWRSDAACRRYLQVGAALSNEALLPPALQAISQALPACIGRLLELTLTQF